MEEINYKHIALFILEVMTIQHRGYINQELINQINKFIYEYYEEHKEMFGILFNDDALKLFKDIFDMDFIELYIENHHEFITLEEVYKLLINYRGLDGYVALVEEIGYEKDTKINELVLLFTDYCVKLSSLAFADSQEFFPKGYPRILQ